MDVFHRFINMTGKPEGTLGSLMLRTMYTGHRRMSNWAMDKLLALSPDRIAELGCGGGQSIAALLDRYPQARVSAIDCSPLSVERAAACNKQAIADGRCIVREGNVAALELEEEDYDLATAFETVCFWPGLADCFAQVHRVLRPGGAFLIANETDWIDPVGKQWEARIEGMKDYTAEELLQALKQAGFRRAEVWHHRSRPWLAVLAWKGEPALRETARHEEIKNAYRGLGKAHSFYDGQMLGTTVTGRWVMKHVWRMTPENARTYQAKALEAIPTEFAGRLLEVPVGTGVISMPVFRSLPRAKIVCLDYSEKMMAAAKSRAQEMGLTNVTFRQGDVGALPFPDESFDAVVSLNGFHAFPDKEAAWRETFRVLKPGGLFCGCFYVEGANTHTDRYIRRLYIRKSFFTPPFETADSLRARLEKMFAKVETGRVQSIAWFRCVK